MQLHSYQERAVKHLHDNDRSALFLDMGLGKTATVLRAIEPKHLPVLVIAPKRVAEHVWMAERDKWRPNLSMIVAAGTPLRRQAALSMLKDVTVIGRDNIKDVPLSVFRTVVLDELSSFKNRSTQRWKLARRLTKDATYVWGLTGTPTPNGLMDLWAQLALIDSGQRLGGTLGGYRSRYFKPGHTLPNGIVTEWKLKPGAETAIHRKLEDICLSMSSEDYLSLPPVIENLVDVDLPPKAVKVYDQMKRDLLADLPGGIITAANAAVVSNKLSQISAGFVYNENLHATRLHDAKVEAIAEIIDGTGSPVLVFYRFQNELRMLQAAFPQAAALVGDHHGNTIERWNRGEIPVLLAHPASAGHGLNLQDGGHTIIWSTIPWSAEEYQQANRRLARQGQTKPVVIHHLMAAGVDHILLADKKDKHSTQAALLDHLKA